MINSLFKDSHIAQPLRHSNFSSSGRSQQKSTYTNEAREYSSAISNNNQGIIANKPAEIYFSGLSSAKLVQEECFEKLITKTREIVGAGKENHNSVVEHIIKIVEKLSGKNEPADEYETQLKAVLKKAKELVTEEHPRVFDGGKETEKLEKDAKETIKEAAQLYPEKDRHGWIYKNNGVKSFLKMANNSQAVFSAVFALGLTCILRPASIMALPGDKKNADDKKYAAAHSISSGVIAYLISLAIFSPIAKALQKIEKHPNFFLGDKVKKGHPNIYKNFKKLEYLKDGEMFKSVTTYVNMIPETILAAPRAVVTIALIPPILKYVFGYQKKSKNNNIQSPLNNEALLNFKSNSNADKKVFQNVKRGDK